MSKVVENDTRFSISKRRYPQILERGKFSTVAGYRVILRVSLWISPKTQEQRFLCFGIFFPIFSTFCPLVILAGLSAFYNNTRFKVKVEFSYMNTR